MHKKKTQRWLMPASLSVILALLFGGLVAQSVRAVISNPTPVCVGSACTVTFDATGDFYLWIPPAGARNISFDLMGAQGGRTGGLGGRVTGTLNSVPTSLYIYVGGAGLTGSGVAGGFNGGGAAGGTRGDEGSGGGATDIRTTNALADRIVVAAGGGGTGGFGGGAGGAAGGLTGTAGTNGQGQGGAGATQSAGGNGGSPNGGTWGTAGTLGIGGTGGTSTTSGGGGGGGGYYGGGGGGADVDSCCTNGGGGGGGSSWSNTTLTSSVVHTAGYRAGAGVAVISYVMPPAVTTFASTSALTNATSLSYSLVFSEAVTGLTNTDFSTTGSSATCSAIAVTGSGANYTITASGCSVGTFKLSLIANSVNGVAAGPSTDKPAAEVLIERTLPTVVITAPTSPTNATNLDFSIIFSEPVTGLAVGDFSITGNGCVIANLTGSSQNYVLQVTNCADGISAQLSLASSSVADAASNLGPATAPTIASVSVDRSAPEPTWSAVPATSYASPSFQVTFSEPVFGFTVADVSNIGTASGCVISLVSETVTRFAATTSNCTLGTVQLSIAQNSYADSVGNLGPAISRSSGIVTIQAAPVIAPPVAVPTPAPSAPQNQTPAVSAPLAPVPTPSPAITLGSSPESMEQPEPEPQEIVAWQPVRKTYSFTPLTVRNPELEQEENTEPLTRQNQITIDNPTDDAPVVIETAWQSWATIGVGFTSLALAAIGVAKGIRQFRNRRLVKRFA